MIRLALSLFAVSLCIPAVAQVQDIYRINEGQFGTHAAYQGVNLEPGKELVLGDFSGPGKITYFYYTDSGNQDGIVYQGLVLSVFWDDATEPSIRVPLWNFFGAFGHKAVDYQTPLMQINSFSFMCYLPMPFSKRARFVLSNDGDQTYSRAVAWGIDYEKNSAFEHETSRLHVAWSRSNPVKGDGHTLLDVTGRGQYIGNFLQANTVSDGWWGEGMAIFNVDGTTQVHAPGTEDEYGATWDFRNTFSTPYTGYIQMDDHKNRMYRWYLPNPVRFRKSLRVLIQSLNVPGEFKTMQPRSDKNYLKGKEGLPNGGADFTSVAFWYQDGAHAAPPILPYPERIAETRSATSKEKQNTTEAAP